MNRTIKIVTYTTATAAATPTVSPPTHASCISLRRSPLKLLLPADNPPLYTPPPPVAPAPNALCACACVCVRVCVCVYCVSAPVQQTLLPANGPPCAWLGPPRLGPHCPTCLSLSPLPCNYSCQAGSSPRLPTPSTALPVSRSPLQLLLLRAMQQSPTALLWLPLALPYPATGMPTG